MIEPMPTASRQFAPEHVDAAFKALASAQRREILRILAGCDSEGKSKCSASDEVCACKISDQMGLAPSTISHHMAVLRKAGLVTARKEGTWVHYALRRSVIREIAGELLLF